MNRRLLKILAIIMSFTLILSMTACGSKTEESNEPTEEPVTEETTETIETANYLYKFISNENVNNMDKTVPSYIYLMSIADASQTGAAVEGKDDIKALTDAFTSIEVGEKIEISDDASGTYSIEFSWDDNDYSICLYGDIAEIVDDDGATYYSIKNYEAFAEKVNQVINDYN